MSDICEGGITDIRFPPLSKKKNGGKSVAAIVEMHASV